MRKVFAVASSSTNYNIAIVILRLIVGIAMMRHGWGKIQNPLGWMGDDSNVPAILQAMAAVSEFFGGLFVALGLLTPLASFGILCTMAYATYKHAVLNGDPFVGRPSYELALVYFAITLLVLLAGAGKFSVDYVLFGRRK